MRTRLDLQNFYYFFERKRRCDGEPLRSHCNSYVVGKRAFARVRGYNESLCGNYRTDPHFHKRMRKVAQKKMLKNVCLDVDGRHAVTGLSRDTSVNEKKMKDPHLPHLFLRNREHYVRQI